MQRVGALVVGDDDEDVRLRGPGCPDPESGKPCEPRKHCETEDAKTQAARHPRTLRHSQRECNRPVGLLAQPRRQNAPVSGSARGRARRRARTSHFEARCPPGSSLKHRRLHADPLCVERDPFSLLGKYVLIGITRESADGTEIGTEERHGRIALVDPDLGIRVVCSDGEVLTLPPDPDSFRDAKPGVYRLRSTGEEVVDPDLTTVWTIREPAAN